MTSSTQALALLYKLEDHEVVPCPDVLEWGRWFAKSHTERVVMLTEVPVRVHVHVRVSTDFIGIASGVDPFGFPLVFESKVFGGLLDGTTVKSATWKEAEDAHAALLADVLAARPNHPRNESEK